MILYGANFSKLFISAFKSSSLAFVKLLKLLLEAVRSDCISHTARQAVPELWSNNGEGSVFKLILVLRYYWFTSQQT